MIEKISSGRAETVTPQEELNVILALIEGLTDSAKQIDVRYKEYVATQEWLTPRIRAIVKHCVNYEVKPGVSTTEIVLRHDPGEVFERVRVFEEATVDPKQFVWLPPALNHASTYLQGEVSYRLTDYNHWKVGVGKEQELCLDLSGICATVTTAEELMETKGDIGCTPLIGVDVVAAYQEHFSS